VSPAPSTALTADPSRRRMLLTGATGFVGQAVLLALLDLTDDVDVVAVVRSRPGASGQERLAQLLDKPSFAGFVASRGEDAARAEFARRVTAIEGDLAGLEDDESAVQLLRDLAPLHTAIHCASAVSFDLPIDEEFRTNVDGATGVYRTLQRAGVDPHVVHVSTAYVGGSSRGLRTEGPLVHDVDWRAEYDFALEARRSAELASRTPEALAHHLRGARVLHGKEGPRAVAAAAERARAEHVTESLVEAGRLRAQTLGWTDVYTFTKAMSERVAEQEWAGTGHRLSVVRPSIIESSHAWPSPGWIDGYKVADPLIMAYGKGMLKEFPALPDSLLDVVPVDMVVGVIVALATQETNRSGSDAYYQVTSGTSNPLPFHQVVDSIHDYFSDHPQLDDKGRPIKVPTWSYRRGDLVEPMIGVQEKAVRAAATVATLVPRGTRARQWAGTLHKQRTGLVSLRKYVDLYKNYTKTEMVFDDSHTRALLAELGDRAPIAFDVTTVDWTSYFRDHHLPAITTLTGEFSAKKAAKRQAEKDRAHGPLEPAASAIAVFDLDGTVSSSTVVTQYLSMRREMLSAGQWPGEFLTLARKAPDYLRAEKHDRGAFLRTFVRGWAGTPVASIEKAVAGDYTKRLRASIRSDARERIAAHRAAGHRTVLVTGVPELLVAPLADLFDEIVATRLDERDGVLTGYLAGPPPVDETRASLLLRYAADHGADLAASYGYGDSHADVTWLSLVGHPFAVSPDLGLYAEAKRSRWPIVDWR
jgi:alcohol-forming fatty acyl-CoA reductase